MVAILELTSAPIMFIILISSKGRFLCFARLVILFVFFVSFLDLRIFPYFYNAFVFPVTFVAVVDTRRKGYVNATNTGKKIQDNVKSKERIPYVSPRDERRSPNRQVSHGIEHGHKSCHKKIDPIADAPS